MVVKYLVTQALKAAVKKAPKKPWKDLRIEAINRKIKHYKGSKAYIAPEYAQEAADIYKSKAKTKREYKGGK